MNKIKLLNNKILYLDNNSTTRLDKRVLKEMLPFLKEGYGNASSSHFFGKQIKEHIQIAREQVASLIKAKEHEIIFTSGATESLNLALQGINYSSDNIVHIITFKTEHKAVLDTCKYLETIGVLVTYLPVNCDGSIDLKLLEETININTIAVCAMFVNNETGIIHDVASIGAITKRKNILFICDATQAVGKIPIDVEAIGIDLLALSAHKFYGPKGVGALYINSSKIRRNDIAAIQHGGGHENGFRSGTLNTSGIIGLGSACSFAQIEMENNKRKIQKLKLYTESLLKIIPGYTVHGNSKQTLFNTLNFHLTNFDANVFIASNRNVAVSNGSACSSYTLEESYVLRAMGIKSEDSFCSLRVSLNKWNNKSDINAFVELIKEYIYHANEVIT